MSSKRTTEDHTPIDDAHPPLTLPAIQIRIRQLLDRLPSKADTAALSPNNVESLEIWCREVRSTLRSYNLVLNFLSVATYQWEPDRPGHTGQVRSCVLNFVSCLVRFPNFDVIIHTELGGAKQPNAIRHSPD